MSRRLRERSSSRERIKRLKTVLHSLATRIPVVRVKRIEEEFPSLFDSPIVTLNSEILSSSIAKVPYDDSVNKVKFSITCKKCKKIYFQQETFDTHKCVDLKCNVCQRKFSFLSSLLSHMKVHSSDRPYKCDGCDNRYDTKDSLAKHVRISHEKYKCDVCDKECGNKSKLLVHKRTHIPTCNVCQKSFKYFSELKRHIPHHSSERTYTCKICDMRYETNQSLKMHMYVKHENKLKCNVCDKIFTNRAHWIVHKRTYHMSHGLSIGNIDHCSEMPLQIDKESENIIEPNRSDENNTEIESLIHNDKLLEEQIKPVNNCEEENSSLEKQLFNNSSELQKDCEHTEPAQRKVKTSEPIETVKGSNIEKESRVPNDSFLEKEQQENLKNNSEEENVSFENQTLNSISESHNFDHNVSILETDKKIENVTDPSHTLEGTNTDRESHVHKDNLIENKYDKQELNFCKNNTVVDKIIEDNVSFENQMCNTASELQDCDQNVTERNYTLEGNSMDVASYMNKDNLIKNPLENQHRIIFNSSEEDNIVGTHVSSVEEKHNSSLELQHCEKNQSEEKSPDKLL